MITTTLKDLRKHGACVEGYNKVVSALNGTPFNEGRETYIRFAHKDPIGLLSILETNGLDDALWALRASTASDRDCRLFAVWCARQVEGFNPDPRVKNCNDVSERFANGEASNEDRAAAWAAAGAAARDAARDAAWAAAGAAAGAAAWAAAGAAARDAARDAAWAARAARAAAWDAQKEMFVLMCNGQAPWQTK